MHDARVRWKQVDNTTIEYDLSMSGSDLAEVLRKPEVWQPIADEVVEAVREKQQINPEYRGLISCMEQKDATRVYDYLAGKYPGLRVLKATTEDGAHRVLIGAVGVQGVVAHLVAQTRAATGQGPDLVPVIERTTNAGARDDAGAADEEDVHRLPFRVRTTSRGDPSSGTPTLG